MSPEVFVIDGLRAAQASAGHAWASAVAAWVLGGAAIIVNIFGFFFLWRQLGIARDTAATARAAVELTQLETRPWLKVEPGEKAFLTFNGDMSSFYISIPIECTNVGKTPAINVDMKLELVPDRASDLPQRIERLATSPSLDVSTIFPADDIMTRSAVGSRIVDPNEAVGVCVLCVVTYRAHREGPTFVTPLLVQENSLTWKMPAPGEHDIELLHLLDSALQPT